jgi:hypothetical protein
MLPYTGKFYHPMIGMSYQLDLHHSIGASILLPPTAFHFFDRIGYTHQPFTCAVLFIIP